MNRPRIITFDCYGTLIDWNAGISQALIAEGERQGFHTDRETILNVYHDAEMRVQSGHYRTYREILELLEKEISTQLGWEVSVSPGYLADSLPSWQPFVDSNRSLERLGAIASDENVRETFERTGEHLGRNRVDFGKTRMQLGPWLKFDPNREMFVDSSQADTYLARSDRRSFVVPEPDKV